MKQLMVFASLHMHLSPRMSKKLNQRTRNSLALVYYCATQLAQFANLAACIASHRRVQYREAARLLIVVRPQIFKPIP